MTAKNQTDTAGDDARVQTNESAEPEYHKAPSVLWMLVPFVLLIAYAYFTR